LNRITRGALTIAVLFTAAVRGEDAPNQTTAAAKAAYSNKLICKREHVTGSMIPKKICRTQEQIDREQQQMKEYAEEVRRNSAWSTVNPDH
jgi:hypothetical protein